MYNLSDYQYELPEDRIAQAPVVPADQSKLLCCQYDENVWSYVYRDTHFFSLPEMISENSVFFFNDTRVVQARIPLSHVRVVTKQGREVLLESAEIFFLHKHSEYVCEALISLLKRNRVWTKIFVQDDIVLTITKLTDKWVILESQWATIDELLARFGTLPLPPYITPTKLGQEHYQTIFAQKDGSVAAPTASLHFTQNILDQLTQKWIATEYVTLHVGLGTFKPVDTSDIRDYVIHEEMILIAPELFTKIATYKRAEKNIIAVWTTVTRVLETLPYLWRMMRNRENDYASLLYTVSVQDRTRWDDITKDITHQQQENYILSCDIQPDGTLLVRTKIFIYPWFVWRIIDSLITNFHVPWSSLLMLVAAAMWYQNMTQTYQHALNHDYRFFSFGDGMWIEKMQ